MTATAALELLTGHRLQRLDSPTADVLAFVWTGPSSKLFMIARLRGTPLGVGLLTERPKGEAATGAITKLRHHVHGAVLTGATLSAERHLSLHLRRGERQLTLELSFGETSGNCRLLAANGQVLTQLHRGGVPGRSVDTGLPTSLATLQAHGPLLLRGGAGAAQPTPEHQVLLRSIQRRLHALERRLRAIEQDAERATQAPHLRGQGNGALAQLHAPVVVERRLRIEDYSCDPPQERWLPLDAGETPAQLAERLFQKARRYERGLKIARERAQSTRTEIAALTTLKDRVMRQTMRTDLAPLREQARTLGCRGLSTGQPLIAKTVQPRRIPYREFRSQDGQTILVGRSAQDNDELTLHYSKPSDLFLHARDCPGAHVLVQLTREQVCPSETLIDAATLAAHFSQRRNDSLVDVSYVDKRHVRKAKGSPRGQVQLQHEKVIGVRVDAARLRRLLASERAQ